MNETFNAFLNFDEHTELSNVNDLAFHGLTQEVAALYRQPRILGQLLDAQGDSLAITVDVEYAGFHFVALCKAIVGVTNALAPRHVGDVNQTVDAIVDTDKDTEVGDVANSALHDGTYWVGLAKFVPWVGFKLTHAQGNTFVLHVDAKNLGLDHIAHLHEFGGVLDPLVPAHLGDVNKTLDSVFQLDECTVIGDRNDLSANDCADGVFVICLGPWVGTNLLVAQ